MDEPAHQDADGPWWEPPAELDLPKWWIRQTLGGSIQARHRTNPRSSREPDGVDDVTVDMDEEQPWRVLAAKCRSNELGATIRAREFHEVRRWG